MRVISIRSAQMLIVVGVLTFVLALLWDRWLPGLFAFGSLCLVFSLLFRYVSVGEGMQTAPASAILPQAATPSAPPAQAASTSAAPQTSALRRNVRSTSWLLFTMLLLGMAMLLHWWVLGQLLLRPETLPLSMQESAALQRLWAGAVSLLIACLILLLCFVFSALLVVNLDFWNLSEPPGTSPDVRRQQRQRQWLTGLRRAFYIVLGLSLGTIILDRGKLYRPNGEEADIKGCAGPIYLDVREGQVAVIETEGLTDTAVDGQRWLEANQRVTGTVDLTGQAARVIVEQATTRDGMIIDRFEFKVRYAVGMPFPRPAQPPPNQSGQFPYLADLTRGRMWNDTPETFKAGVVTVAEHVARTEIGRLDLREIGVLPGEMRGTTENRIRDAIQVEMDRNAAWLVIRTVAIGRIDLPDVARKELIDRWAADVQLGTSVIRAETQKATMILKGEGQAGALRNIEAVKTGVRDALIRQLSPIVGDNPQLIGRYLDVFVALAGYMAQDNTQALRVVEGLEDMARSSKAFTLNIMPDALMRDIGLSDGQVRLASASGQPWMSSPPWPMSGQPRPGVPNGGATPPAPDAGTTPPALSGGSTPPAPDGGATPPALNGGSTLPVLSGDATRLAPDDESAPPPG